MGQEICSYCSGSGRDAVNPTQASCWKCHGSGGYWVQDQVKSKINGSSASSGGSTTPRASSQYQLLPRMERIFDSIPSWLNILFAVIGIGLGVALAQAMGFTSHGSMAMFAVGGFFLGLIFLRLSIVLIDMTVQLSIGLFKIAIILAIIGGIGYLLLKWIGAS